MIPLFLVNRATGEQGIPYKWQGAGDFHHAAEQMARHCYVQLGWLQVEVLGGPSNKLETYYHDFTGTGVTLKSGQVLKRA